MTGPRSGGGPVARGRYHHGELAEALVEAGLRLLTEVGPAGFSVAEIARRVRVSTAAPYRHFADRDRLLAAVTARAADQLATAMESASDAADTGGAGDAARIAAAAGAYAEFVAERRVGFDLIFAPALRAVRDEALADAGRRVMDALLTPAGRLTGDPREAMRLVEGVVALAHGFGTLDADGFLTGDRATDEPTRTRAARAVAALVAGAS